MSVDFITEGGEQVPVEHGAHGGVVPHVHIANADPIDVRIVGAGGEDVLTCAVSFDTESPTVLVPVAPGQVFDGAALLMTTAFDDPTARVQLGTGRAPAQFLDVSPVTVGQFNNDEVVPFTEISGLLLTVVPGTSTRGSGFLLYRVKRS